MSVTSKDKIKSLIVSGDRSFRSQTIRLFNDIAFPAEKFTVASVMEARGALQIDPRIENVLVNGEEFEEAALKSFLGDLATAMEGKPIKAMVYMKAIHDELIPSLKKANPIYTFKILPIKKADFIEVYHASRAPVLNPNRTSVIHNPTPPPEEAKAAPAASPQRGEAELKTFFEATNHVRETVDALNQLLSDSKNIARFIEIGQRFNGVMGAFAFVRTKPGYKQIFEMATALDDLVRTYQKRPEWTEVKESHLGLTLRAVKCALLILKELRENAALTQANLVEAQAVFTLYSNSEEIEKRASASQDEVDALLDKLGNG